MIPEISVVLPYYNAENTLAAAVQSILGQTFGSFELLLVNNNSSDNSLFVAQYLAEKDSRIRLLEEKNRALTML